MLHTLTDPRIVSVHYAEEGWSVESLLMRIATARAPRFHALIDTGALITVPPAPSYSLTSTPLPL